MMTPAQIDEVVVILQDVLKIGATAYPPLAVAAPLISAYIAYEATTIKTGLANGTLVPDGMGGIVPATNSRYDPATGKFL
jgi:hypothetical protein